ncbi:MAG: hypothetical protein IIB83_09770, partial [Bacteroidetes bacterium]|nr:hypothetical protein [Bacteroidota bacterium]
RIRTKYGAFTGRGVSTDIIEASAKAYLSALNKKEQILIQYDKESKNSNYTEVV